MEENIRYILSFIFAIQVIWILEITKKRTKLYIKKLLHPTESEGENE